MMLPVVRRQLSWVYLLIPFILCVRILKSSRIELRAAETQLSIVLISLMQVGLSLAPGKSFVESKHVASRWALYVALGLPERTRTLL